MITHTIAERVARYLEKAGYLMRDAESPYLDYSPEENDAMNEIVGASVTYRLAFGPRPGIWTRCSLFNPPVGTAPHPTLGTTTPDHQ